MYTASVQQIGRVFRDKREKKRKKFWTRANKILTLNKYTKPNNTITSTQNKHDANVQ